MKKLLYFFILLFFAVGCSYDIYEEINYFDNREATTTIRIDFSKSMQGQHKDMIINMITESVKSFAKSFGGKNADKINFDSLDLHSKDTKVFFEMALDTVKGLSKDSLLLSFEKKDTLNALTRQEKERLAGFMHELLKRSIVRFNANLEEGSLYFEIESNRLPWDKLNSYKLTEIASKVKNDSTLKQLEIINAFPINWTGNKLVREGDSFGTQTVDEKLPTDSMAIAALKNSNYIIKYNFPGKVIKNTNPKYKISEDGKSVIFNENFYDLTKDKIDVSNEIEYK